MQNTPDRPRLVSLRLLLVALLLLAVSAGSLHAQVSTYGAVASGGAGAFGPSAAGSDPNAAYGGSFTGTNIPFTNFDQPTALEPMPTPPKSRISTAKKVFQAICWYLPNRLADLTDIPRFHVSMGDGQGVSLRATRLLTATWFEDDAYCIGWTKRTSPWFGEAISERYLGFLAAQEGNLDRDPTEVGISAHALIAGFNAAISLGEIADAAAGIVGIDLSGDDHGPVLFSDMPPPPPGKIQAQREVYGPRPHPGATTIPTSSTTPMTTTPQPPAPPSTVPPDTSSAAPKATSDALAQAAGSGQTGPPKTETVPAQSEFAAPVAPAAASGKAPLPPIAEVQMENAPVRKSK